MNENWLREAFLSFNDSETIENTDPEELCDKLKNARIIGSRWLSVSFINSLNKYSLRTDFDL